MEILIKCSFISKELKLVFKRVGSCNTEFYYFAHFCDVPLWLDRKPLRNTFFRIGPLTLERVNTNERIKKNSNIVSCLVFEFFWSFVTKSQKNMRFTKTRFSWKLLEITLKKFGTCSNHIITYILMQKPMKKLQTKKFFSQPLVWFRRKCVMWFSIYAIQFILRSRSIQGNFTWEEPRIFLRTTFPTRVGSRSSGMWSMRRNSGPEPAKSGGCCTQAAAIAWRRAPNMKCKQNSAA